RRARAGAVHTGGSLRRAARPLPTGGRAPMRWLLLALLACQAPAPVPVEAEPVEVRTWFEGRPGPGGGVLVVQTAFDRDGEVKLPSVAVAGLSVEPVDDPAAERIGDREVVTQRYRFSGPRGSYEIPAFEATWTS